MNKTAKRLRGESLGPEEVAVREKRAERVLLLRKSLNLTRDHFHKKHGISPASLQTWEDVQYGGMPESGAYTLAAAYQKEGIPVTVEWLMYGLGKDPLEGLIIAGYQLHKPKKEEETQAETSSSVEPLMQEIKLFYQHHQNAIHFVVEDDGLSPWIKPGDYVAGKQLFGNEIKMAVNYPCIIETENNEKLARIVRSGSNDFLYTLVCSNPETIVTQPTLKDKKLLSAAPIMRIWKPTLTGKF